MGFKIKLLFILQTYVYDGWEGKSRVSSRFAQSYFAESHFADKKTSFIYGLIINPIWSNPIFPDPILPKTPGFYSSEFE